MLTNETLKAEVLRLAAEHPDAVYFNRGSCKYTEGECGGGLVVSSGKPS